LSAHFAAVEYSTDDMASKLNFRARTLDASKPLSIYNLEDLPELTDLNAISRSVPAMPSGMEKEEEAEKHLQEILESQENAVAVSMINTVQHANRTGMTPNRKMSTASSSSIAPASPASTSSGALRPPSGLVIPTPDVYVSSDFEPIYYTLYKGSYKSPRQYIHVQPFAMDEEMPVYDLDEEDMEFIDKKLNGEKKIQVDLGTVEDMLDRLEKNSDHNVVSAKEAKLLLKEDDDLILAVYDYWMDKRLRLKQPLAPKVKRDNRALVSGGASSSAISDANNAASTNPYIAFRRRTEKMQTRKNRKNDEASYEKMLKLRRDLNRAVTLLEMVKRREKTKKERLVMTASIFEKRFKEGDFDGKIVTEALQKRQQQQRAFQNLAWVNQLGPGGAGAAAAAMAAAVAAETGRQKRPYTKKKKKTTVSTTLNHKKNILADSNGPEFGTNFISSDDESSGFGGPATDSEDPYAFPKDPEPFAPYAAPLFFRRKRNCQYLAPAVDDFGFSEPCAWPWDPASEGGGGEAKYRYSLASLSTPSPRCVGLVRRRVGRGGRIVLDRAHMPGADDQLWRSLDFTVLNGRGVGLSSSSNNSYPFVDNDEVADSFSDWPHYRPVTPPFVEEEWPPGGEKYKLITGSALPPPPGLPTQPLKQQQTAAAAMQVINGLGLKKKSVDAVAAHNTATAVVTKKELEIFSAALPTNSC
jgi:enhancer of polycomb-like protein